MKDTEKTRSPELIRKTYEQVLEGQVRELQRKLQKIREERDSLRDEVRDLKRSTRYDMYDKDGGWAGPPEYSV